MLMFATVACMWSIETMSSHKTKKNQLRIEAHESCTFDCTKDSLVPVQQHEKYERKIPTTIILIFFLCCRFKGLKRRRKRLTNEHNNKAMRIFLHSVLLQLGQLKAKTYAMQYRARKHTHTHCVFSIECVECIYIYIYAGVGEYSVLLRDKHFFCLIRCIRIRFSVRCYAAPSRKRLFNFNLFVHILIRTANRENIGCIRNKRWKLRHDSWLFSCCIFCCCSSQRIYPQRWVKYARTYKSTRGKKT